MPNKSAQMMRGDAWWWGEKEMQKAKSKSKYSVDVVCRYVNERLYIRWFGVVNYR